MAATIKAESVRLQKLKYATTGCCLTWNSRTNKKSLSYPRSWQHSTYESCVDNNFGAGYTALALVTGDASDIFVVDLDGPKPSDVALGVADGREVFAKLCETHGGLDHVPCQRTGNDGRHFFFSLSKTLMAGLQSAKNRSKIKVDARPTTIDTRGDAGNVIIAPTSYIGEGGSRRSYVWEVPLCAKEDLPACPRWFINILNKQDTTPVEEIKHPHKRQRVQEGAIVPVAQGHYAHIVPTLEEQMGCPLARSWPRTGGFDFDPCDRTLPCPVCGNTHGANQYLYRDLLDTVYELRNYSTSCRKVIFGYEDQPVIKALIADPARDAPYVKLYIKRLACLGQDIVFGGTQFYIFDNTSWQGLEDIAILHDVRTLSFGVLDALVVGLSSQLKFLKQPSEEYETLKHDVDRLRKARSHVQKASNIHSILDSTRQLRYDPDIEKNLDRNPDLLACNNGVVELQTGGLRPGRREDYVSLRLALDYGGIDLPTPDIDAFMWSVFEDEETITYMQRLLGYAITGHTREQVWAIWYGSGANGKGVLNALLYSTLGELYVTMSPDCIIKQGRAQNKGAPTPFLAALRGKRMGVCDEAPEDSIIDDGVIKRVTGGNAIEARFLGANPIVFEPTHLPVLMTNHRPRFNTSDAALLRRTVVVPFQLSFKPPEALDHNNPSHRPIDKTLAQRLTEPECLQQMLTWLVRGAVAWYREGLPTVPARMSEALNEYLAENDTLQSFLDEDCVKEEGAHVETKTFKAAYESYTGQSVKMQSLVGRMRTKGIARAQISHQGSRPVVFKNITIRC